MISFFGDVKTFHQTLAGPEYSFRLVNVILPISALICNMLILQFQSLESYLTPLILFIYLGIYFPNL